MGSQADQALAVAKALIDALSRRDPDNLIPLLHDDVVLEAAYPIMKGENVTGSKRCEGEAVREFVRNVVKVVSQIEFRNVIWRTTSDGLALFEADGDLKYINGDPYENHYLMFFEVAESKVVRWREYYSPVIWARASGTPLDALP